MHVPKTGGTSFFSAMRRHYGEALIADLDHTPGGGNADDPVALPAHARAVHGHFRADRYAHFTDAFHVTFLRDPVERFISNYYFWLTLPPTQNAQHQRLLADKPEIVTYARHYTKGRLMRGFFERVSVDSFDYVGFTDRVSLDYPALSRLLGFEIDATVRENVTALPPHLEAERSAISSNADTLAALKDALRDDYHFYDLFRARWT